MDYLDPKKKRKHAVRLYIGYGLITMAIAIATTILVFVGSGFYVDRNTGDLIQNGQLFINSAPDGATISLNGKVQRPKTSARLVIPGGEYKVVVSREGFKDWKQSIILDGGRIQSLDYIRLLPQNIKTDIYQTFATSPTQITQSSDRRYLSFIFPDKPLSVFIMDTTKPDQTPSEVVLPKTLFSAPEKPVSLKVGEWSDDNKHFMLENTVDGAVKDYIVASRESSEQPTNITVALNVPGQIVSLRNRAFDQFFVFNVAAKTVSSASLSNKTLVVKASAVLAFKAYGNDDILYITPNLANSAKVQARLLSGDKSYLMRDLTVAPTYLIDMAKLGNTLVLAVGSPLENKVTIIRNPLAYLKAHPEQSVPLATTVLQVQNPTEVSFSTDATTVVARGAQHAASHYFDEDHTARFDIIQPLGNEKLRWIDGKHFTYVSTGLAYVADYDGANAEQVMPSMVQHGIYFDTNYQAAYGFTSGANGKPFDVTRASLVAN